MTYHIAGGSVYDASNYKIYAYMDHDGYPDVEYGTRTEADMGTGDCYWRLGGTGGQQVAEIGLNDSYRIRISSSGIEGYSEDATGWVDLLIGGGASQLSDLTDVNLVSYTDGFVLRADGVDFEAGYLGWADIASKPTTFVYTGQANTYTAGMKQSFQANATTAGLRLVGLAGNPSAPVTGDLWYDTSANRLKYRGASANREVVALQLAQTLTNKTVNATDNTITDTSTALGDLLKSNGTKFTRLARGTDTYALKSTSTDVSWGQIQWSEVQSKPTEFTPTAHALPVSGGYHSGELALIDLGSYVRGSLIRGGATDWEALAKGTNTYVLKSGLTDINWGQVNYSEVQNIPSEFTPISHDNTYHSVTFVDATGAVSAVNAGGLALATTKVITSADENLAFTFGRAGIGIAGETPAYFGYRGLGTTTYALHQDSAFATILNGVTNLFLRVNNSNKMNFTVDGMQLVSNARVTTIYDQNDMLADSDTALATQQSIKAYADTKLEDIVEDTTPQLGGYLDLNDKGFTQTFIAAENLANGNLCHLDSSGQMAKAQADAEGTCDTKLAMCLETITTGNSGKFLLQGKYTTSGLSSGYSYWVSPTTAGAITPTQPSTAGQIIRRVGDALSSTILLFNPDQLYLEYV